MAANFFRSNVTHEPGPSKKWMVFITFLFVAGFLYLIFNAVRLQLDRNEEFTNRSRRQHHAVITLRGSRGAILDRHNRPLALSAMRPSIIANTKKIEDPKGTFDAINAIIPLNKRFLKDFEAHQKTFIWLARQIDVEQAERIEALNLPGIRFEDESHRTYPNGVLAGPLLGFSDIDGNGQAGLERDYDSELAGKRYQIDGTRANGFNNAHHRRIAMSDGAVPMEQLAGNNVTLTIDTRIQQIAESALEYQISEMGAAGGTVVVLDPKTSDILAMAQTPAFNPNAPSETAAEDRENKILTHVFEPGSIIKPLLVSAALDAGKTHPNTIWPGFNGTYRVGTKLVRDSHAVREMTTLEVLKYSSNVGATQIGQRLGKDLYHNYLRAFGLGEATGLHRLESSGTLYSPRKWGQVHLATISYGYGLTVTPLQMARAYGAIANGGVLMQPRLISKITDARGQIVEEFPVRPLRRVISKKVADEVTRGLVMVTNEGGTGKRAAIPGYEVAGKTGTAHLLDSSGKYSQNRVRASFAGFVPARDPRLVIVVSIEDPIEAKYGGTVSAPVFSAIAREVLPYLGVPSNQTLPANSDEEYESDEFSLPSDIEPQARPWWFTHGALTGTPSHLLVPDLRGRSLAAALELIEKNGIQAHFEGQGLVVEQSPEPGALLLENEQVQVKLALKGEIRPSQDILKSTRFGRPQLKNRNRRTSRSAKSAANTAKPSKILASKQISAPAKPINLASVDEDHP